MSNQGPLEIKSLILLLSLLLSLLLLLLLLLLLQHVWHITYRKKNFPRRRDIYWDF